MQTVYREMKKRSLECCTEMSISELSSLRNDWMIYKILTDIHNMLHCCYRQDWQQ